MAREVFVNVKVDLKKKWVEFKDIDPLKILKWEKIVSLSSITPDSSRLYGRKIDKELRLIKDENQLLINIVDEQCNKMFQGIAKPVAFLLTSVDGTVIAVNGQVDLLKRIDEKYNLGIGTIFELQKTGINAITLARELDQWVYLNGAEHYLDIFSSWSCFCSPIRHNNTVIGYLDLSFADQEDHVLFAKIFDLTVKAIESDLLRQCPNSRKDCVMGKLKEYKLAPREMEIGYMWLMNNSVRSIAEELFLAEGTVRLVTKKIYRKTGVSDKGEYIRKFS